MSLELPATIISLSDLQAAILDLEAAAAQQAEQGVKNRGKGVVASLELVLAPELAALITGDLTEASLRAAASDLKKLQKTAPTVEITLADVARPALKTALTRWFRHTISPIVLVDFSVNRQLAGGALIRAGGEVFDWSFRRKILDGRDKLGKLINV